MKNKGFTYLLLIVVAVIWYQVFFRIKSNLETNPDTSLLGNKNQLSKIKIARDTFNLDANYRDPFGGKISHIPDTIKKVRVNNPISKPVQISPNWVKIKYYGSMKKTESKNPLAVMNIDGEQFFLRKGEEVFDGYKVLAIYKDSVLISYQKKNKYFYKN